MLGTCLVLASFLTPGFRCGGAGAGKLDLQAQREILRLHLRSDLGGPEELEAGGTVQKNSEIWDSVAGPGL